MLVYELNSLEWQQDMQGQVAEAKKHQQAVAAALQQGQQQRGTSAQTQQQTHDQGVTLSICVCMHICHKLIMSAAQSSPVSANTNGCNAQASALQPPSTSQNPPDKLQPAAKRLCV